MNDKNDSLISCTDKENEDIRSHISYLLLSVPSGVISITLLGVHLYTTL